MLRRSRDRKWGGDVFFSSPKGLLGQSDTQRYKSALEAVLFNVGSLGLGSGGWGRRGWSGFLRCCWKKRWLKVSPDESDTGGLESDGGVGFLGAREVPHQKWHARSPWLRTRYPLTRSRSTDLLSCYLVAGWKSLVVNGTSSLKQVLSRAIY